MAENAPRLLFVPVSGPFGMGEYARSLAIAQGFERCWPEADIRFVLSREASYAATVPYAATLLESSATFHTAAVVQLIDAWRPHVVIFDNAGRSAQLRAAQSCGCRVVFISARRRQRRRAFRMRWMRMVDEHWIAYPEFITGPLRRVERLKLALLRRPVVRHLDVIMAQPLDAADTGVRTAAQGESYVLVVPGGGTGHPGAADAGAVFLDAARRLATAGARVVFVGRERAAAGTALIGTAPTDTAATGTAPTGTAAAGTAPTGTALAGLHAVGPLPQAALATLMRGAALIVANGGSTLLQAIAYAKPCIAVPIAGDQRERIARCVAAQVAVAAPLAGQGIVDVADALLRDRRRCAALESRAAALGLADGVDVAIRALRGLLHASAPAAVAGAASGA